ncbi:adenosylmethionine-8-amino-7-oxononanoate aminotransferase apoenzyme [Magnetococcus marinus MC-1]|uniref:Adenosylmethionine-8-amino-7-oxononanoate aminotransferase n=1 Tax=Magnetococcus marinus (strain ATCC BAA-1437 / JCM 17883 / MC-1) TaxID=156889 RepID=A0L3M3_MAGMM|nr:adenosylmethionine--8-amino-7-oxononanoate transaminase [Magnetococcus marinus]ABK42566.1 adenosylmethionine-8-amino-7-oxononanoate aminotransferase apoenzyme [Magnetococcus marinus MC-1]
MTPSADLIQWDKRHCWHPFTQAQTAPDPIPMASARGATLTSVDGRTFIDLNASWWVTTHGHAHPAIAAAIAQQAQTLEQVIFAGFTHAPAVNLATRLSETLGGDLDRVFFSDDGSTAVEVALKMAAQYHINQGTPRHRFVAFRGGYHGDTVGAMSMGQGSGFFDAFQAMLFHVDLLDYPATWLGDPTPELREALVLSQLDDYLATHGPQCGALLMEPLVQGAAGMRMARAGFVQQVMERCRAAGVLVILDEVMTGFGRTGTLFAFQQCGDYPDIICLSKGLTAGFMPMSVTVVREPIYQAFMGEGFERALAHGHSFTANPLGCVAALASLELFEQEGSLARIGQIAALHQQRLEPLQKHAKAVRPRVCGSIGAIDLRVADGGYGAEIGPKLKAFFIEKGLLMRPLGNTVYLLPPYCVSDAQLHQGWDAIEEALDTLL